MTRVAARPDTLPRLSDSRTKRWAAAEEWALKLLCRLAARLDAVRPSSTLRIAPWLDAYYRSTAS
jgi:hypothetical protein